MYLLYFRDIPYLVSCAFSTIPIFPLLIHIILYLLVKIKVVLLVIQYLRFSVVTSISKYDSCVSHSVVFFSWRSRGYMHGSHDVHDEMTADR